MMTLDEIRLKANPVLTNLLLGRGQGTMVADRLFPRLPQSLSTVTIAKMGDAARRRYNLRRAPGTATKQITINFEGKLYTVKQHAVEVPIPRELIRESDEARKLNLAPNIGISTVAMTTARDVLNLDYEIEAAEFATNPSSFAPGHSKALAGAEKWSAATGTPVTDIRAASNVVRKKVGRRPNKLMLSADAETALISNAEVKSYLPSTQLGPATHDQLKTILNVKEIVVGDATYVDEDDEGHDVWGNAAVLAYAPDIPASGEFSLAEPAFGFTNVIEGHPFSETPLYRETQKSWIYGGTYERSPNIAYPDAGFLFLNPN